MRKMITENPEGMVENMHNMVFVKEAEVYLRGMGKKEEDISLVKFCKEQYKNLNGSEIEESDPCEFGEYMDDDSLLSQFYWLCVGFAEVREKLKCYEERLSNRLLEDIELAILEDQFRVAGYTDEQIEDIKNEDEAKTTEEFIYNLTEERSYWGQ